MRAIVGWLGVLLTASSVTAGEVLVVADEFPAMELLAAKLKAEENLETRLLAQKDLPANLSAYSAVVVYIHLDLAEQVERALIQYTRGGGKLVALHHSISSGKRKNKDWFGFLGVSLPPGGLEQGGYKWIEPAALEVACLQPGHFITTNRVQYPAQVPWTSSGSQDPARSLPGFRLEDSEVYLNHVLVGDRTLLLGFRYVAPGTGQVYEQTTAGWLRRAGRGWIIYLMPGHSSRDFEEPAYARIVANALLWQP